ncbi:MAG TPA: glycerophosphodiester phosphodiesterase family protein [Anaerolineae bacterium]|nr:glycerophosphodiester phosphodiesterase family protein [Anaerolineae bacterium]
MSAPLILAHRGASAYAPENTIAAFLLARELGADGIELDVQLTKDKIPVVIHDDTVERTTNSKGRVSDLTIAQIAQLDAGSWKTEDYRGEPIPTLAQVFDALADWLDPNARPHPALINVELKTERLITDGLEREVLNVIARYGLQDCILLSSFSPFALYRAKQINPRLKRGLLYDNSMPIYFRRAWLRPGLALKALHPEHTMIDTNYMQWARHKKLQVNTWTVDDPAEAQRLAELGVNAIITNQPDTIRGAVT